MRANHSPLQFFGLIATASVLASGVYANAALAGTIASTTESNGASASPVLVGSSSASETGTRSLVDGTRAAVDSNRTSRALRARHHHHHQWRVVESHKWPSGERLGDPSPAARAGHHPRGAGQARVANARRAAPRVDIGVTPLVGGGNSAGAPTSATVPSATTTTTAPTDPSPADSAAGTPLATQLSARQAPASQPAATKPAATQPVAAAPPTSVSNATQPVATPPSATEPSRDRTCRDRTCRDASRLKARSAQLSPGNRTRTLHRLQTLVTQWLRAEKDQVTRRLTRADSPVSPSPSHPSLGAGQRTARAGCRIAARPRR